ncbi:MAG: hypothetical protein R2789_03645 [Microthrixaceae bacterium]
MDTGWLPERLRTHPRKEGADIADLTAEVVRGTLADASVDPEQIESIHVGNAFGQLYNGQGHLGAMPASVIDELWGVPAMRHEAACASSSVAVLSAMAEIEAGRYDCVLVLGWNRRRPCPAPTPHAPNRLPPGSDARPTVWSSSGRRPSMRSPRSTTGGSASMTPTCVRSVR